MRRFLALLVLALLAALAAGCFNPFDPRISDERAASSPAPAPNTPANTVRLFVWCWAHRDPTRYAEVFTDDYRFIFQPNDSAGNPFRERPWLREDEMASAQHLFSGGADQPPASGIEISIDSKLVPLPDPRPGHDPHWHKTINTHVDLKVTVTDASGTPQVTPVVGNMLMYLVRGDSAVIPSELVAQGFKRDSTRWWIDRWEDQTIVTNGPASARPVRRPGLTAAFTDPPPLLPPVTWGWLKQLYRPDAR
jgi:hypothetical protein